MGSKEELTHTISERMAWLLGSSGEERLEIYDRVKALYGARSRLVHGAVSVKKGRVTSETLYVNAKMTIVPLSHIDELTGIVVRLLRAVLDNRELLQCIQEIRSDDATTKAMSQYYRKLILQAND